MILGEKVLGSPQSVIQDGARVPREGFLCLRSIIQSF